VSSKADRFRKNLGPTQQRTEEQDQLRKQAHEMVIPGIQGSENAVLQENENDQMSKKANKKRATFEFDEDFHAELKVFAARHKKKMVDVVIQAIREHMDRN